MAGCVTVTWLGGSVEVKVPKLLLGIRAVLGHEKVGGIEEPLEVEVPELVLIGRT